MLVALSLFSCEKDEIPRKKPLAGSADIITVSMGSDYANQLFFNLKEEKVVSKNNREIWDLGFESALDGFHITLNSSKIMAVHKTSSTELAAVTTVDGTAEWTWDKQSGNLDSTAFGNWTNQNVVYVVDRGTGITGLPLGKMKMKVLSVNDTEYKIEWAGLTETTSRFSTITKNNAGSMTYFSFNNSGSTVTVEPAKETWDICFTAYTHIFDGHTPYSVTGVLSNRYKVKVAAINNKSFAAITYVDYLSANFPSAINTIGYNWKVYNFDTNLYEIDMSQNFIVETGEGHVYKLHFLDFYDDFGTKGAPTMEMQELVP